MNTVAILLSLLVLFTDPGFARSSRSSGSRSYHSRAARGVPRDKHGHIKRSATAKRAFEREHPCPSTGKTSGRCPGYVIDHVMPLQCGGADAPFNMQWQTTGAAKTKDKTEAGCRL